MNFKNSSTVIHLRYFFRKLRGKIKDNTYVYQPKVSTSTNSVKEIFEEINQKNIWGSKESVSGKGSELKHTNTLLKKLDRLNKDLNIKSMVDAPCGDFNWMKRLDRGGINYNGIDIVEDMILDLNKKYADDVNTSFMVGNIMEDRIPQVDLIFCRDCLVHFSFDDIHKALMNFKQSGSKYLLTTNYGDRNINRDIQTGGWRPINLQKPPFNLNKPLRIIKENNLDDNGLFLDKSMALWKLSEINLG